jgi:hypothetical protein
MTNYGLRDYELQNYGLQITDDRITDYRLRITDEECIKERVLLILRNTSCLRAFLSVAGRMAKIVCTVLLILKEHVGCSPGVRMIKG